MKTHGQMPGKDGKGFGVTTSAWYHEESEIHGDPEMGSGPLDGEGGAIVVTTTRNVESS